jgi:signal transduction histidine kinase
MDGKTPGEQTGRLAGLLREQLNDMMAAAYGLSELLPADGKSADYLAVLNRGLCRQLRVVRRLELDHKLSSEDEIRLLPEPVDLVALCRGLMEEVGGIVRTLGIRAEFVTGLNELVVCADGARLEDMLLCLISNSVQAMKAGGELLLSLETRGDQAIFLLADNGGGATAEALAEFFGAAEEECDIPEHASMGAGLPLARKIAALHGGFLLADNYEGKGMRLVVSISTRLPGRTGELRTPGVAMREEGWNKTLVELSECLPASFYAPKELDA